MLTKNDLLRPADAGLRPTESSTGTLVPRSTSAAAAGVARALSQAPASSVATVAILPAARASVADLAGTAAATAAARLVRLPAPMQPTFSAAFEAWLGESLSSRKDRGESVRRSMHKDVMPTLGSLPLGAVRRSQVVALLERIVARGSARQAGCVLADLRQMFRWAAQAGYTDSDPTATLRKQDFGGTPEARQRRLSDRELAELAERMRTTRLARHVRHAVWLMLATGARIGEVAQARWADIDTAARLWTIPAHTSHSGRVNVVALSAFALRHLLPPGEGRRSDVWVFPGRIATEPLSPKALGKQIRDRQRGSQIRGRASGTTALLLPGGPWTPLDLRRTAAALMAELGVRADVIAACLDQAVRSDSHRTTHRSPTLEERRFALERLGQRLEAIEHSGLDPKPRAA